MTITDPVPGLFNAFVSMLLETVSKIYPTFPSIIIVSLNKIYINGIMSTTWLATKPFV